MPSAKMILITGVTYGLGRAMVDGFIRRGHTVVGCARSQREIEALQQQFGSPHAFRTVDVSSDAQVKAWAAGCLKSHGAPDLLINNAGVINENARLWEVSAEDFARVIDVNLKGAANV